MDTEVTFYVSTGYVGAKCEETFTLGELGYDPILNGESDEDIEKFLGIAHEEWRYENIDFGWIVK